MTNPGRRIEFHNSLQRIQDTFKSMENYSFSEAELDLSRGERLIKIVRKVVGDEIVITCSTLKWSYRDPLLGGRPEAMWLLPFAAAHTVRHLIVKGLSELN